MKVELKYFFWVVLLMVWIGQPKLIRMGLGCTETHYKYTLIIKNYWFWLGIVWTDRPKPCVGLGPLLGVSTLQKNSTYSYAQPKA